MLRAALLITLLIVAGCRKKEHLPPIDNAVDLDGNQINDSSLINPSAFLQSMVIRTQAELDEARGKHIFIAVHGFSASGFEWQEFSSYCRSKPDVLVSRVLLGGHGRDYSDFRKASWQDWQSPIIEEYDRLVAQGFTKIHFIAASTGCPLVIEMLQSQKISVHSDMLAIFIDPIIVPSNKQLSLAPIVGGTAIHYTETEVAPGENGYWYKYRPQEALKQLNTLTTEMRRSLEKGITLDAKVRTTVYKSEKDGSADPVSAVILERGLSNCEVKMVGSGLHVFTRLKGREGVSDADRKLQQQTFEEIYNEL